MNLESNLILAEEGWLEEEEAEGGSWVVTRHAWVCPYVSKRIFNFLN